MPDPVPVQTQQQQNAASQAWLAANHPDWNQNAGTPQQAAQTNQAYLNNTLPVLPSMAPNQYGNYSNETFTAYTPTGTPYLVSAAQDAINEQQKYAQFNAPINYGNFANMSLGQIASQYGTTFADRVQGYYTEHPTANFQAINQQYNQQHQNILSGGTVINPNTFVPTVAAGAGGFTGGAAIYAANWQPLKGNLYDISPTPFISTEPTRNPIVDTGATRIFGSDVGDKGITTYVPYGSYTHEALQNTKDLIDKATGELGVYQFDQKYGTWDLISGGSRNSLQSGMFTVGKAETPYVTSQAGAGTYALPSGYELGLSRLGAEAYGGVVRPMTSVTEIQNVLSPNEAISRYAGTFGDYNLANYVNQVAGGKAEAPGANIPWSIAPGSPAIQYMDQNGIVKGSGVTIPGLQTFVPGGTTAPAAVALPAPFISKSEAGTPTVNTGVDYLGIIAKSPVLVGLTGNALGFGAQAADTQGITVSKGDLNGMAIPFVSKSSPAIVQVPGMLTTGTTPTGASSPDWLSSLASGNMIVSKDNSPIFGVAAPGTFNNAQVSLIAPEGKVFGYTIPGVSNFLSFFESGVKQSVTTKETALPTVTSLTGTTVENLPSEKSLIGTDISYDKSGNKITTNTYQTIGGTVTTQNYLTTDGKTVTKDISTEPVQSGWEWWTGTLNKEFGDITGISKLPTPTIEQTKQSNLFVASMLNPAAALAIQNPVVSDYAAAFVRGEAIQTKERPLDAAVNYGIAYLGGGVWRGVEEVSAVSRASMAEKAISEGGGWRGAETFLNYGTKAIPVFMGAAYGTSVYQRTTEGGTDFSPMAAERAGKIFIGEALPGALGFSGGYKAPGEVYSAAVESNNAYKEALLKGQGERTIPDMSGMEQSDIIANSNYGTAAKPAKTFDIISGAATEIPSGTILKRNPVPEASRSLGLGWGIDEPSTTGRFDYYVKQPVVNAVTSPISYVKGDYAWFLQNAEAITPSVVLERPAFIDYVMSKVGAGRYAGGEFTALPEYGPAPAPEPTTFKFPEKVVARDMVSDDYIRLYRGESSGNIKPVSLDSRQGRWFTEYKSTAEAYSKRGSGEKGFYGNYAPNIKGEPQVSFVDLPKVEAMKYSLNGGDSFILPPEKVNLKQVLLQGGQEPPVKGSIIYERVSYETPSSLSRMAYGKQSNPIGDLLGEGKTWEKETPTLGNEITTFKGGQPPEVSFREPTGDLNPDIVTKAYGTQPTVTDRITGLRNWFDVAPKYSDSDLYSLAVQDEGLGLSKAYGNTPIDRPIEYVKLLWQESSYPQKISDFGISLRNPKETISLLNNDNVARAFRITEGTGAGMRGWKSTMNIFGKEPANTVIRPSTGFVKNAGTPKANAASGGLESQSGSGAVSLSGIASGSFDRLQGIESGINGMPLYPSGPSPIQKQRYTVEEETQYYPLPPGMTSPGPKSENMQTLITLPSIRAGQSQVMAQVVTPRQLFANDVISRQEIAQTSRQDFMQVPSFTFAASQMFKTDIIPVSSQRTWSDVTQTSRQNIIVTPFSDITTRQTTDQITKQITTQIPTQAKVSIWYTPPPSIPGGLFGLPPSGGGGGSPFGSKRRASFRETFMLGLDIAATGRRQKKAKSWASPKKTKSKRKK